MARPDKESYDVIIIGAGISGLVCGCYLAKAGQRVLIAEQHNKPGGYCTSFRRGHFTFDAAAHCFGGYRKDGLTRKIFEDLGIDKKLNIIKSNPSDIVTTPHHRASFWTDLDQTINEFQSLFPEEQQNVKKFFNLLVNPDGNFFIRMRRQTLKNLLDSFFTNDELKTVLAAPLLGLGGLPPSLMSAFVGVKLYSEFLLDGGYHPEGGMQTLSNTLAARFRELGGELLLSSPVKKIRVQDSAIRGVVLESEDFVSSRYIVSNCDARQTFLKLIGQEEIEQEFLDKLNNMTPSISNFILYLGLDEHFEDLPNPGATQCYFSHYDLDKAYQAAQEGDVEHYGGYMFYVSKEMRTLLAIIPAPFRNKDYWINHKTSFSETFMRHIEKNSIPHLSKHVVFKEAATPHTLYRYTLNYRGASFGWAGTPSQLAVEGFKKYSSIQGLYFTGHWTTQGLGISGVAYVGQDTAKIILRKEKMSYNGN